MFPVPPVLNGLPNNNQPSIDCKETVKKKWKEIPLFIKTLLVITSILYIVNLPINYISFYLSNIPYYTIFNFQIWRLLTSVFMTTSIFNIIFALFGWVKDASSLEISMGTIKYMLIFIINSLLIQVICTIIVGFLGLIISSPNFMKLGEKDGRVENSGFWPIILCEITLLCMSNPDSSMRVLCFPCEIKAKYYPIILFVIYSVLNAFSFDFQIISGIIYGLLYHYYLKKYLQISDKFIQKLETSCICNWMMKFEGFVSVNHITSGRNTYHLGNEANSNEDSGFKAFRGQGVTIGGSFESKSNGYSNLNNTSDNKISFENQDTIISN